MSSTASAEGLVGRDRLTERLHAVVERVVAGQRAMALVAGEAGIGKTALLGVAATTATRLGARVAWGAGMAGEGAPGYWPWTQALDALVRGSGADRVRAGIGDDDAGLLASIVPSFDGGSRGEASDRDRLLAMDATVRLLATLAEEQPVVIVLDDLQWADDSSLALLDFVARAPVVAGVGLIGAYRHDELPSRGRERLGELVPLAEHLHVEGLDVGAVRELVARLSGAAVDGPAAEAMHRRTGGHPFFVRELALLGHHEHPGEDHVPVAVHDAIDRRIARLPDETVRVLETASVVGSVLPDVLARVLDTSAVEVETAARAAIDAGVLAREESETRFAHDLLRETLLDRIALSRRVELHRATGDALESRLSRGGPVASAELAHHFTAAITADGPERAVRWALSAADDDCDALAFREAADHLRRLRAAATEASVELTDHQLVDVLLAEADALSRAGNSVDARGLLHLAAEVAARAADPVRIARAALATVQLGATFATRRDEIVRDLEAALEAVRGVDDVWEARVSATLARELQHSVPEDRPRAGPLSEKALELGRKSEDPATLLTCLLARHDLLWTPGEAVGRSEVAVEIIDVARAAGDQEGEAQGLLLLANARLELGSPAFDAALESCLAILDDLGQLRHRYTADTRRACLALLRGRLDDAERLIEQAARLGERLLEPDTANVRMSQQLEHVRARADAGQLREFAADAVRHWTGAPVHAHAVAAGFLARAGDVDAAAHHVATVVDLGSWQADRSYLWSVFVRELAQAAVALEDRALCRQLFDDLGPLVDSCGVNGAVVAFAGSHAHTAGLLAAALGESERAGLLLDQASSTYRRLGATGWLADVRAETARSAKDGASSASMRRVGAVWHLGFSGKEATVAHTKGLADIARLLAAPGTEIHVLELVDAVDRSGGSGDVVDRSALDAYRQRLADLDDDIDEATLGNNPERRSRAEAERQAIVDELGRVSGMGRRPRQFANHPAERARKAVAGRIRDAIRKLEPVLPELAAHLQRTIVTGNYCRYRPDATTWVIDARR